MFFATILFFCLGTPQPLNQIHTDNNKYFKTLQVNKKPAVPEKDVVIRYKLTPITLSKKTKKTIYY